MSKLSAQERRIALQRRKKLRSLGLLFQPAQMLGAVIGNRPVRGYPIARPDLIELETALLESEGLRRVINAVVAYFPHAKLTGLGRYNPF